MNHTNASRRRLWSAVSAALPLLGAVPAAIAADESRLEEVVVTATRRTESAQDIPVSITAVSADVLDTAGVVDARDLVALAPNLSTQGSFGRTAPSFFIRGIGNTQFNTNANSKVGVYVDDVYLNSPAVQGVQLFDIERVEIARGPQGYLFGQNTTGGLVRAIVEKPRIGAGLTGEINATVANYDEIDVDGALGFDLGERAAARLSVTSLQSKGYQENRLLGTDEGDTDVLAGRAQLLFAPSDDLEFLLNIHGSQDDSELIPYKQLGLVDPATFGPCPAPGLGSSCTDFFGYDDTTDYHEGMYDMPNQFNHVDAEGASLTINWQLAASALTSVTAYEQNDSEIHEDTDVSPNDVVHGDYTGSPEQFSQEIRLTSTSDGPLRWLGGLYYFTEDYDGSAHFAIRGFGPGALTGFGTTLEGAGQSSSMQTDSYAVFGNVDYSFSDQLRLSVGLRYTHEEKDVDYVGFITNSNDVLPEDFIDGDDVIAIGLFQTIDFHEKKDWDDVSGRISLDYRFTPDVLGYVSYARGFNSGNYNGGAFFDQSEATLVDPEKLNAYEIGVKSELADGTVRLNADVFYYDFKDQQAFILASGSGGAPFQQLSNAAASTLYGAEAELVWKPVEALLLQAGAGYTHSKFDEFNSPLGGDLSGNELPSAPEWNFNLMARYEWQLSAGTLAISADTKFTDDQFFSVNNDPLLAQDAYWLTNARIEFAAPNDRWSVAVWARNLADEDYFVAGFDLASFGFDQLVVGAPRTYGLTVGFKL
jgi:iron complex outermembrane receptor protein